MESFVIAIARGYGSGGRTIGKMIAGDLQVPFYDRELLYLASDDSGINVRLFGEKDEKLKKGLISPLGDRYRGGLIPPESADFVSDKNLFNYQAKIIKEVAEKGSCVIVGRCADYILRDRPNLLSVYVWAPMDRCIRNVLAFSPGISEKEAERRIRRIDAHRNAYYKYYTAREWNDYRNYELCINTSKLGYEKSAKLIEACLEIRRGTGCGRSSSDLDLK